jgi:hypothetical protein
VIKLNVDIFRRRVKLDGYIDEPERNGPLVNSRSHMKPLFYVSIRINVHFIYRRRRIFLIFRPPTPDLCYDESNEKTAI